MRARAYLQHGAQFGHFAAKFLVLGLGGSESLGQLTQNSQTQPKDGVIVQVTSDRESKSSSPATLGNSDVLVGVICTFSVELLRPEAGGGGGYATPALTDDSRFILLPLYRV